MTAQELRALARDALKETGAGGFVRFAPEGDEALLLTDATARLEGERREALLRALKARGFVCALRGELLCLTPNDALLSRLGEGEAVLPRCEEESPLAPACALADRWLRAPREALTPAGRRLALEAARLLWQPRRQVLFGLRGLRARAAALQRAGDRSALRLCGAMLARWCARETGESCRPQAAQAHNDDRQEQEARDEA